MAWPFTICDVFTERPLAGNQLAVFTEATPIPEALLQPLALELNFSETVFVYPPKRGGHARIRIFSPTAELRFAGHPILGAAAVIGATLAGDEARIETSASVTPVALRRDATGRVIGGAMRQPVPTIDTWRDPAALLTALGVNRSLLPIELYDNGLLNLYVALESREAVRALTPDPYELAAVLRARRIPNLGVTCFSGADAHWKTRTFAPSIGVQEDAATGSAAGPLAVHLVRHGKVEPGTELEIRQGAEIGRPSVLRARAIGARDRITRVEVSGGALVVGRGEFDPDMLRRLLD